MSRCSSVSGALLFLALVTSGSCFVWNRNKNLGQIQPREINIEEFLAHSPANHEGANPEVERLFRRQTDTTADIGHTQHLNDTHYHGLVHWTGFPSQVLFILTRSRVTGHSSESWLWRSTDYGHSFSNDTKKWANNTVIEWYYIAPLNEFLIFADRTHRTLWVTRDEGETYSSYSVPFAPDSITFQSSQAPGSNSSSLSQHVLGYDSTEQTLWVTMNLGRTWTKLGNNVTRYNWRVLNSSVEDNTTVYFEQAINSTHSVLRTSSHPYESQPRFPGLSSFMSNTFVLSDEYMFVQLNTSGNSAQYSSPLWVSRNRKAFRQARFPLQTQEKHYAVVDTSEDQVFIAVYHDINSTHLYLSEVEGLNYTLSLNYIISPPENEWQNGYPSFDMHVVEGIVGTFIANIKDPSGRYGTTVISYDKGGNWGSLRPPSVDRNGFFINCQPPECSLHLHIQADRSNGYQSILTQDSAIGLVMASGNLGSVLVNSASQLRLYFSRDGGFTWFEVNSGYWQFQFAGQGAIVATIQRYRAVSSVLWSCNEGISWDRVRFLGSDSSLNSINVIGMLTEIGERALHVTVFGITFPFSEWLVTDLNFTSVLPNQCDEEDFFIWVPTDDRPGSRCLLGEAIEYERRNSSTCCYANPGSTRLISRTTCNCTQEDFECDFGFERIHLNSPCTPLPDFPWPPLQPDQCPENTTYTISSGYRRVAGDKCTPGEELSYFPIDRPCIVGQPAGVLLQTDIFLVTPHTPVHFTLTQQWGGKLVTVYTWDFNDSAVVTSVGYNQSRHQLHSFSQPGVYNITVNISNSGGTYNLLYPLTVLDLVSDVEIVGPSQLTGNSELPAGRQLLFATSISTQYNTTFTGNLQYAWSVASTGGSFLPPRTPSVSITFPLPGVYTVTVSVGHPVGGLSTQALSVQVLDTLKSVTVSMPDVLTAGQQITFTPHPVTQYSTSNTGQLSYRWNFGDGQTNSSSEASVQHQYPAPGNFTLSLNASNAFSWRTAAVGLLMLDEVTGVTISPLIQLHGNQLPTQLRVVFQADITTRYSTSITGQLSYAWDFGDGSPLSSGLSPTTSHTFGSEADITVRCTVSSPAGSVSTSQNFSVFEASHAVTISSDNIVVDNHVKTQQQVDFLVESDEHEGIIPPDTHFAWHVVPAIETSCPHPPRTEAHGSTFSVTFHCWGTYDVSVVGNHSAGSFAAQLTLKAQAVINYLSVSGLPAVSRSGAMVTLSVRSGESAEVSYAGPINLFVLSSNGTKLGSHFVEVSQGTDSFSVGLSRDDVLTPVKNVTVMARNEVSSYNVSLSLALAVKGDYAELQFLFRTSQLPSTHQSKTWHEALADALKVKLQSSYLSGSSHGSVDVEEVGYTSNSSNSEPRAVRSESQEFLYVNVDLLPVSLSPHDVEVVRNVSLRIQADATNGPFEVTVNSSAVVVTAVEIRNTGPVLVVEPVNWKLYAGLGAGLGVGLILVVAIAIILGVALYTYKRRYSRLNVRYARLRQTPVRFTFTQGGEMVEDEDYEEPTSEDEGDSANDSDVKMNIM